MKDGNTCPTCGGAGYQKNLLGLPMLDKPCRALGCVSGKAPESPVGAVGAAPKAMCWSCGNPAFVAPGHVCPTPESPEPEATELDEYANLTPREAADKFDKEQESERVNEAMTAVVREAAKQFAAAQPQQNAGELENVLATMSVDVMTANTKWRNNPAEYDFNWLLAQYEVASKRTEAALEALIAREKLAAVELFAEQVKGGIRMGRAGEKPDPHAAKVVDQLLDQFKEEMK